MTWRLVLRKTGRLVFGRWYWQVLHGTRFNPPKGRAWDGFTVSRRGAESRARRCVALEEKGLVYDIILEVREPRGS